MFEITVESEFCSAHAILIAGKREPAHGHNWHVTLALAGDRLDADGLLLDFHALERTLADVLGPFRNADLNKTPPFDRLNPSAENVARHIADSVSRALSLSGPAPNNPVRVAWVRLTEAPGCAVVYRPPCSPAP